MQSVILKILISISWLYLFLLSIERQAKAVLTQSENGKFVIYQSTILGVYLFSLPMTKAAAVIRQSPGFHCFFMPARVTVLFRVRRYRRRCEGKWGRKCVFRSQFFITLLYLIVDGFILLSCN
ncbi:MULTISPECIES: hypothetical protein [Serratia]|uniref:hypothetical protein n=2 Tax=Serratia TaxID=613 RepID=UPI000A3F9660|nr:hypothetical protein [Serratia marcescens]EIM8480181.1 hypothetical protein [Serratia marcescens]EIM8483390.1 hypothetical protein [Serratia marcescens]EIM8485410.1 hypothetical protein [Serratia marcescens]EIM8488756.1 hypothetical protein [Serratia marcescens]EIU9509078.1 hypothetical protein [Serratia marcescens]